MNIKIYLFAQLREIYGNSEMEFEVPRPGSTVREVVDRLSPKAPSIPLLFAVNEEFVTEAYKLNNGDVLAILPPVAGG